MGIVTSTSPHKKASSPPPLSLCIATMDRWEGFLQHNLPRYLANPWIAEVVLTDENGRDADAIEASPAMAEALRRGRLRIFRNAERLGPLLNKLRVASLATHDWICLMDSDNFADVDYFEAWWRCCHGSDGKATLDPRIVYMPSKAAPRFDFTALQTPQPIDAVHLAGLFRSALRQTSEVCLNTGNYILNRQLLTAAAVRLPQQPSETAQYSACDVIFLNHALLEFSGGLFLVVPNMQYSHVVHDGSIYLQTFKETPAARAHVHARLHDYVDRCFEKEIARELG